MQIYYYINQIFNTNVFTSASFKNHSNHISFTWFAIFFCFSTFYVVEFWRIFTPFASILQALTLIENVCMLCKRIPGIMCGKCIVYTLFATDISETYWKRNRKMQKKLKLKSEVERNRDCIKESDGIVCTLNATDHNFLQCKPVSKTLDNFRFVVELLSICYCKCSYFVFFFLLSWKFNLHQKFIVADDRFIQVNFLWIEWVT